MKQNSIFKKILLMICGCVSIAVLFPICAFAGTITINTTATESHAYTAYQIIEGEVDDTGAATGVGTLIATNADTMNEAFWFSLGLDTKGNYDTVGENRIAYFQNGNATDMNGNSTFTANVARAAIASGANSIATFTSGQVSPELKSGLYLIVSDNTQPMMMLIGAEGTTVSATEKSDTFKLTKNVLKGNEWVDAKDIDITDTVIYRLATNLPSNYAAYDKLTVNFVDTLPEAMSVKDTKTIQVYSVKNGNKIVLKNYTANFDKNTNVFTVSFTDIKQSGNLEAYLPVYVEYDAIVNAGKETYGTAHPMTNKAYVEYTKSPSTSILGKTETDDADVYTFELSVANIDGETSAPIIGGKFTLQREDGAYRTNSGTWSATYIPDFCDIIVTEETVAFQGIGTGTYTLTQLEAAPGYEKLTDPVTVVVDAELDKVKMTLKSTATKGGAVDDVNSDSGVASVLIENQQENGLLTNIAKTSSAVLGSVGVIIALGIICTAVIGMLRRSRK